MKMNEIFISPSRNKQNFGEFEKPLFDHALLITNCLLLKYGMGRTRNSKQGQNVTLNQT